jgi:hypothetical protein
MVQYDGAHKLLQQTQRPTDLWSLPQSRCRTLKHLVRQAHCSLVFFSFDHAGACVVPAVAWGDRDVLVEKR